MTLRPSVDKFICRLGKANSDLAIILQREKQRRPINLWRDVLHIHMYYRSV